jgi:O-antigen ligase
MTGIILLAIIVGAIWTAVFMMRMPLLYGVLATVLVGAVCGHGFPDFIVSNTRWSFDRVILLLLLATFIIQRQQGFIVRKPMEASEWLLIAFLGWITISMLTHDFRVTFGHTATPPWRWLTGYCIPVMLYWIARQSSFGERQVNRVQTVLVFFGIYLAFTGIFEVMRLWALVYPKHIADPTIGIHFGRARGPMVTAVSYGLYLGAAFICLWAMRDRLGRFAWLVLGLLTPLFAAGLYYSYTRSSWIGAGLGLLIVLAVSMRGKARIMTVGGLAACALLVLTLKMDNILYFQREQSSVIAKDSAECRLSFAYVSWKMFEDSPIWGVGFGLFPTAKMPYLMDRVDLPLDEIRPLVHHNTFLCLLTETGIAGLGLFVAVLFCWAYRGWQLSRDESVPPWVRRQATLVLGVMGLYVCQLTFHELSYSVIDNNLMFMFAGTMMGAQTAFGLGGAPVVKRLPAGDLKFASGTVARRYNPVLR